MPLFAVTITHQGMGFSPTVGIVQSPVGTPLPLRAIQKPPWLFDHWQLTAETGTFMNPITITANAAVCAVFVPNPDVNISQEHLLKNPRIEQAVRVALDKLSADEHLYWRDLLSVYGLDLSGLGLTSLDGVDLLCNLTYLDVHDNYIRDLTPLGNLSNLQMLNLGKNEISNLAPLARLTNLSYLELGLGNQLVVGPLDLSKQGNLVADFTPLKWLGSLQYLGLSGNSITDLTNQFTDANYGQTLMMLTLDGNPIGDLSASASATNRTPLLQCLPNLIALGLGGTGFTNSAGGTFFPSFSKLAGVDISGNPFQTLGGIDECTGLQVLICDRNPALADISALAQTKNLNIVYFGDTQITTLGLQALNQQTDSNPDAWNFINGTLILRDNTQLSDPCALVSALEDHGNTVDRDFACGDGERTLKAVVMGNGSIAPFVGTRHYPSGSVVHLEAVQTDPNFYFLGWDGVPRDTDPMTTVFLETHQTVTAVFLENGAYHLLMRGPSGGGTVTPAPGNWACRTGETRHITAVPKPGWVFTQWITPDGTEISTDAACEIGPMTSDRTVQAVFKRAEYTLRIIGYWGGNGYTIPPAGRYYYLKPLSQTDPVQNVTIQGVPESGGCFAGWGSATLGMAPFPNSSQAVVTLPMNQNYEAWAVFDQCDYTTKTLEVQYSGRGLTTPEQGTHVEAPGSEISITASPMPGWEFIQWEENNFPLGTANPLVIQLTEDRTIRAVFGGPFEVDDFQRFLMEIHSSGTVPDAGAYQLGQDCVPQQATETVSGYSIPDVVRLDMVAIALRDPALPVSAPLTTAYMGNLRAWYAYVNAVLPVDSSGHYRTGAIYPTAEQMRTYAAYSTLSEKMQTLAIAHFLSTHVTPNSDAARNLNANVPTLTAVPALAVDGDLDGDGFSNGDEWRFSQWSLGDTLSGITGWEPGAQSAQITSDLFLSTFFLCSASEPVFTGQTGPPTVQVTIATNGGGTVYPPAGTYTLPKYALTDWYTRDSDGMIIARTDACPQCNPCTMNVQAAAAGDWFFDRWQTNATVTEATGMEESAGVKRTRNIVLTLDKPRYADCIFDNRPGLGDIELVQDLAQFLHDLDELPVTATIYSCTFDRGGKTYDSNGNAQYIGDGIPDVAQFALLEHILKTTELNLSATGGVSNETVWKNYQDNIQEAQGLLSSQPAYVQHVTAAYLTMGGYDTRQWLTDLAAARYGVSLNEAHFYTVCTEHLTAEGDADKDGYSNLAEWNGIMSSKSDGPTQEDVEKFGAAASDPSQRPSRPPDRNGTSGCFNNACTGVTNVTLWDGVGMPVTGEYSEPDSGSGSPDTLTPNNSTGIRPGRSVCVQTTPKPWFTGWTASGTMITGCTEASCIYTHGGSESITVGDSGLSSVNFDSTPGCYPPPIVIDDPEILSNQNGTPPTVSVNRPRATVSPCEVEGEGEGQQQDVDYLQSVTTHGRSDAQISFTYSGGMDSLQGWSCTSGSGTCFSMNSAPKVYSYGVSFTPLIVPSTDVNGNPLWKIRRHGITVSNGTGYLGVPNSSTTAAFFQDNVYDLLSAASSGPSWASVGFNAVPYPGYQLTTVDRPNAPSVLWVHLPTHPMASGPGEFSVTVHSAKQARLFLKARIMDWIMDYSCDTACAGYVSADPAGYYYDVPVRDPEDPSGSIGSSKDGTRVTLTANPNPGFVFDHWEGDGICWTSTAYITMTDPAYAQLREASCRKFGDKDKPVTNDTIYIQMNNKATFDDDNKGRYSGEDRTITAVYMPDNAAIAVINAGLNSLNGMEATAKANGYKRFVTLQSKTKAKVLREVARGKVFAFAGHGSDPGSNPPPGVGQGTHMCGFQGNTLADTLLGFSEIGTNKQYRLVMFACCYCGLHASDWESAFNADVFIGFKDNVQGLPAEMFGDSFWMYANTRWQDGTLYSLSYSAFKAWGDQVNNASTYIPAYSDELVFEPQGSPITIENVTCQ